MMQWHFATLSSKYNIYCVSKCINTYYVSLDSQRKKLSYNINHIVIDEDIIEFECREYEKRLFQIYFLNQDISLINIFRDMKFQLLINDIQMEGTVSPIFDIGPCFCFMKCRKLGMKKSPKSSRLLT